MAIHPERCFRVTAHKGVQVVFGQFVTKLILAQGHAIVLDVHFGVQDRSTVTGSEIEFAFRTSQPLVANVQLLLRDVQIFLLCRYIEVKDYRIQASATDGNRQDRQTRCTRH